MSKRYLINNVIRLLLAGGRLLTSTSAPGETTGPEERTVSARVDTVEVRDTEESNQTTAAPDERQSLVLRALGSPALRKALSVLTPKFIIERSLKEVYGDPDRLQTEAVNRYYELLRREGNRQAYLSRREMQICCLL